MDFGNYNFKLRVSCTTFNHSAYIKDAMNGFCMQETNFPFICAIMDDSSTDGAPVIIKDYLQAHFDLKDTNTVREEETEDYKLTFARHKNNHNCFFAVYFLKYNHYSKNKSRTPYVKEWAQKVRYTALCEGDDYWTDPCKLQQQVGYLESHPECRLVCTRAKMFSLKNNAFRPKDNYCRKGDGDLDPKEVIRRGGYYIPTCSVVYRMGITGDGYPDYCRNSPVGDYPLQIWMAMKGNVYYFDAPMAVYRVDNPTAWSGKKDALKVYSDKELDAFRRQVEMLKGFAKDFPEYAKPCIRRAEFFINSKFRSCHADDPENQKILDYFKEDIAQFGILGRIDKRMRLCGNKYLLTLYYCTAFKWLFRNYLDLFW